jgi:hypothetical protein
MLTKQKPSDMSCQGNAVLSLIAGAIKGCVFADIVLSQKSEWEDPYRFSSGYWNKRFWRIN